jgi:glycerol-3-phosphate acyltransferase PlsY
MDILWSVAAILVSYLIGSISMSRLALSILSPQTKIDDLEVKLPNSEEVYKVTAKGAAAASMVLGGRIGCAIGFLDMFKSAAPTLIFRLLRPDQPIYLLAALAVMAGHNWPIFYRFKGGRGISSVYGSLFVVDPIGALVVSVTGLIFGLVVVRDFFIAYLSGLWLLIPWMWWRTGRAVFIAYAIGANVLFVLAMIPDLKQYMKYRREGKFNMEDVLQTTPMGRGMSKIMDKLHLRKK